MPHVVIAEGNEVVRQLMEHIVSLLGWTYDSVSGGQTALEVILRVMPEVVIADIMLGGINGLQLLAQMKIDASLADIPVVIMSAIGGETESKNAGCDAFLAKPFAVQEALRILSSLVPEQSSTN